MINCLSDENLRLKSLFGYDILDTEAEATYDDITQLAASICEAPTALISFVDEKRQWFKSRVGLNVSETPRDIAFCAYTILNGDDLLIVENAAEDDRFRHNPLVTGAPQIRFYAGAPLVTPDGFVLGSLCVIDYVPRDLSEDRQKALKTLARQVVSQLELRRTARLNKELSERYRLFVDNSPTVIFIKDDRGRFVAVNRLFEELFRIKREEVEGKEDFDIFPLEIAESVIANDRRVLITGETLNTVEFVPTPDGTPHYWFSHKFLIEDAGGQKFVGGIAVDITERKKMEADLEAARDAALESLRLKSAFLTNVSHELRTPMNAIIGVSELLLETPLSRQQQDYLKMIRQSSDSLMTIINDTLDLSKIEAGKLRLEEATFDVRKTVISTVNSFIERASRKNIEISSQIDNDVPQNLYGDSERLKQVLHNLIDNSVKFTEEGSIKIEVKTAEKKSDQITLRFDVVDTGIGIEEKNLRKLFQPFTQIDDSPSRKYGGTGLGLIISQQIVEMMSGRISVKSDFQRGSRFSFTAKFTNSESRKSDEPRSSLKPLTNEPKAAGSDTKSLKLLVVEDNDVNRLVVTRQLKHFGINPDIAVNGQEAVEKAEKNHYQIILMDCQMPVLDGYSAAREIRRREQKEREKGESYSPSIIIALTAHTLDNERERCLAAGMNDYLSKPAKAKDLEAMINSWSQAEPEIKSAGLK